MIFKKIENFNPKVISFIGAGGKSTLIRYISSQLRDTNKVLISSTIDVNRISEDYVDLIDYDFRADYNLCNAYDNGVYAIYSSITFDGKLRGLPMESIKNLSQCFDISLIECDFSMGRKFKAWRKDEPTVPDNTDTLVYVLDISIIGSTLSVDNVHNLDVFVDSTGRAPGEAIEMSDIVNVINSKDYLIESKSKKRVLYINKVENEGDLKMAEEITKKIDKIDFDLVVAGSLHNKTFKLIKEQR